MTDPINKIDDLLLTPAEKAIAAAYRAAIGEFEAASAGFSTVAVSSAEDAGMAAACAMLADNFSARVTQVLASALAEAGWERCAPFLPDAGGGWPEDEF